MKYYIILPFSSVLSTVWYAAAATPYFSCSFHLKDLYDILYYKVQLQSNENFNLTQQAKMCKHVTKRMFICLVHSFGVFFFCKSMSFVSAWAVFKVKTSTIIPGLDCIFRDILCRKADEGLKTSNTDQQSQLSPLLLI